jgi:hypothetical protein
MSRDGANLWVQRREANGYMGVAIDRLQEIADALKLQVFGTVRMTLWFE